MIFLLIAVAAPIMEEIVFRGGFIGLLFEKYPIVGIISSVAVFTIIHSVTNLVEFLIYGAMGLIMALIYVKTKRLETAIAMHFLNNALAAIAMILLG
ncbi:MAG: CPBP family intramembrane glutamic endopeptidase [Enterococcus casseliflavus]|nr:CPBP family intramembrane glutamic endopeptidase [Enterococcus casseliflavus]